MMAIPWAVPGTVFAVALATTFSVNQPWIGRFVLIGTPGSCRSAYVVQGPAAHRAGRRSRASAHSDPALEEAAASLGAGRWRPSRG